jgi:transcriptional regulator with XRE-family HTH domain
MCGSLAVTTEAPSEYRYENSGLPAVILVGNGVLVTHCSQCKNVTTTIRNEQQLIQVIGLMLLVSPPGMKGQELRFLRTLYGMTQAELATALNDPRRETISDWEAKRQRIFKEPSKEILLRLVLLHLFKERVIGGDHCFLEKLHRDMYSRFTRSFVARVPELLASERKPAELSVRHRPGEKIWSPVECLAA